MPALAMSGLQVADSTELRGDKKYCPHTVSLTVSHSRKDDCKSMRCKLQTRGPVETQCQRVIVTDLHVFLNVHVHVK